MCAHAEQRGPGLWDEVCSPKMQWWSLLALADLFVINRPHTPTHTTKAAAAKKKASTSTSIDAPLAWRALRLLRSMVPPTTRAVMLLCIVPCNYVLP